jgi:Mg2+-importing ATPase
MASEPLTPELLARQQSLTGALNAQGLRVVAVAVRELPPEKPDYGVADESALTLVGYVAFLDPPKETTAPALAALASHGVTVKILTGDNEAVTAKVCHDVGLLRARCCWDRTSRRWTIRSSPPSPRPPRCSPS